jgi:hypothetical protein
VGTKKPGDKPGFQGRLHKNYQLEMCKFIIQEPTLFIAWRIVAALIGKKSPGINQGLNT